MKDMSYDVPALQFRISYPKLREFNSEDPSEVLNLNGQLNLGICQIMFSQVDGLTIEQFFEVFQTKAFNISCFIDTTDMRLKQCRHDFRYLFAMSFNASGMSDEERKMEISAFIANRLLNYEFTDGDSKLCDTAVLTFLERYRGTDYTQTSDLRSKLKIKKRN